MVQTLIELSLRKSNNKTPWGFRLCGGAEVNSPLIVVKVYERSYAQEAGLLENDVIVRINEEPTAGVTHAGSHEIIRAAGNSLILAVRRGDVEEIPDNFKDKSSTDVITDTRQLSQENSQEETEKEERFLNNLEHISHDTEENDKMTVLVRQEDNPNSSAHNHNAPSTTSQEETRPFGLEGKQWSSFLQKPKNPVPAPKVRFEEPEKPQGETYKVVIKKQKRKRFQGSELVDVTEEQSNDQTQIEGEVNLNSPIQEDAESDYVTTEEENIQDNNDEVNSNCSEPEKDEYENEDVEESVQQEIEEVRSPTLEEQLAEIQKQLQQLSQLPSSVQETLNAVTQKLNSIVAKKCESHGSDSSNVDYDEVDCCERDSQCSEGEENETNTEAITLEETFDDSLELRARLENSADHFEGYARGVETDDEVTSLPDSDSDEEKPLTEEEIEAARLEKEKEEKLNKEEEFHQRRLEQRPTCPLKPRFRPIILPGGRKWCDPEDVVPKARIPKMTDERIATTLDTYSEVISGKTKGINFLKYTPPPKNLDYLQRSEVYRLVHDMEPPVKGISNRGEKVLAAEDYYEKISQSSY